MQEESTWEPAGQFSSLETIRQWEHERDGTKLGLDDSELQYLLGRIEVYEAKKNDQGSPAPDAHADGDMDAEAAPMEERPSKRQKTSRLVTGQAPLLRNRGVSPRNRRAL
jgi:hypothetical protein